MNARKPKRTWDKRLSIPRRLAPHLPKVYWALHLLRQARQIEWVTTRTDERKIQPFMSTFDEETQETINRLVDVMKPPRQSRSAIVATALQLYADAPKANEPDRGLAAANVDLS